MFHTSPRADLQSGVSAEELGPKAMQHKALKGDFLSPVGRSVLRTLLDLLVLTFLAFALPWLVTLFTGGMNLAPLR